MDPILLLNPMNLKPVYQYFKGYKEKSDLILEPLQACIQIAYLDFCSIGTKLSLEKNLLYIDSPNMIQSFRRDMGSYKKQDIHYIFKVLKRYILLYKDDNRFAVLVELLNPHIQGGLDKLIKTYEKCDDRTIIHTLEMYIKLLKNKNLVKDNDEESEINHGNFTRIKELYTDELLNIIINTFYIIKNSEETVQIRYIHGLETLLSKQKEDIQLFIKSQILCI